MNRYISVQGLEQPLNFVDSDLPLSIGEDQLCDIAAHECTGTAGHIGDSDGHLFFQPVVSPTPVFHNNCEISSSVWLKSGDNLRICSSFFQFTVSGDHYTFVHSHISEQSSSFNNNSPQRVAPASGVLSSSVNESILPREASSPNNLFANGKWLALCGLVLSFLVAACLFILFARPVYFHVIPAPDTLSMRGFLPVIPLGSRILSLPGSYTVTIEKEGYSAVTKDVEVVGKAKNHFSFTLDKLPGKLQCNISPASGVAVFIDGSLVGHTPLENLEISAGAHQIRLEKERYLPLTQKIDIAGMLQEQLFSATLLPAWAVVSITTTPSGADVYIDGAKKATTPAQIELLQGSHRIEVKKRGFITEELSITSTAGQAREISISLIPSPATVAVDSVPSGVTVLVNNEYKGVTPFSIDLPSGQQQLFSLQTAGYSRTEESYMFQPKEKRSFTFTLTPEYGTVFFQVEPPMATLYIDGKKQVNSNGRFQLPVKQTQIEAKHPGYKSYGTTLVPKKSYSQKISINLEPQSQTASPAEIQKVLTSQSGKKMILVSPSPFTMGAPRREAGRRANEHEHKVVLKRPFYVSSNLVTNEEFKKFRPNHSSGTISGNSLDIGNHPVVNVTWKDAVLYLNWLSEKEGLKPFYQVDGESVQPVTVKNTGYRLLSEAEWAYVARKEKRQQNDRYPWMGGYPPRQLSGNYGDQSSSNIIAITIPGYNDAFPVTSPVGSFPANPAGLFDLGGNAAEWCHDYYNAYNITRETDPMGPPVGTLNVIRGSGWRDSSVAELRLSYRGYHKKEQDDVGFRIARYAQ